MITNLQQYGKRATKCRMCNSTRLEKFLNLGHHPHSDHYLTQEELDEPEVFYPLSVYSCRDCGLAQLGYVVSPDILYRQDYIYEASITRTGREHYRDLANTVCSRFGFGESSLAIDIGSNVGVLLAGFKERNLKVLGVDPADNIAAIARSNGIETITEYFSYDLTPKIIERYGKADVITATNVFAHIHDVDDVVKAINNQLKDRGVFVIEAPWFLDLVKNVEYDTIYHQHLGYLSLKPMQKFFRRLGMEVFDVDWVPIHGGTLRYFIARSGAHPVSERIAEFVDKEERAGLYSMERLFRFANEVHEQRQLLGELLSGLKKQGKRIVGISAPAKGNTLLNFCKINQTTLDYLTEKSKYKIGRFSPGMHIPIHSDEKILEDQPDYALILAWNFSEEIIKNMEEYRLRGGKFIIPIPRPYIV